MKIRAKQDTQIVGPKGLVFVQGPVVTDDGVTTADGQIVDVPDSFDLNPDVWEEVRKVRSDPDVYEVVKRPVAKKPAGAA